MDMFEYALLTLSFEDVKTSENAPQTKGYISLNVFRSDGMNLGVADLHTSTLGGNFVRLTKTVNVGNNEYVARDAVCLRDSYPLSSMMPYISMLGKQGWRVIETKTDPWPAFAQALLERKIEENIS